MNIKLFARQWLIAKNSSMTCLQKQTTPQNRILGSETFIKWLIGVVVGSRVVGAHNFSDVKTAGLRRRFIKKELDIMGLRHNEVNFEATFDDHLNYSKCS